MHTAIRPGAMALLIAFTLAAAPAAAQEAGTSAMSSEESTVPPELQTMVGDFVLAQEDESEPQCPVRLTDRQSIGGWAIELPEPCPAPFPTAHELISWNVDESDGSVLFMDGERKVVLRLLEDEDGLFDTDPNVEPRFYLLPPYVADGSGGESDGE